MRTPTIIRHCAIRSRYYVVVSYSHHKDTGGAAFQCYEPAPQGDGATTLVFSRPWATEQGACGDFARHLALVEEGL